MARTGLDQNALIDMFASASAKQSAQLRDAVRKATLGALQGRELTLKNIRGALKSVSEAANTGLAKNVTPGLDVESMLDGAVAGMDDALLKAVEANRAALQQFVDQGVGLQEKQLKKALGDLEKFEDTMIDAMKKSAQGGDLRSARNGSRCSTSCSSRARCRARRPRARWSSSPRRCRRRCATAAPPA